MQSICIDRIEGGLAVCESGGARLEIPREQLPQGAKEGDWLLFDGERYLLDEERTRRERAAAISRFAALKKRGNSHG